jgi:dolichyl-phosphate beta-glucosyltransferase
MLNLSIIIPAYNEEHRIQKTLEKIINYLKRKKYNYEIIIVDDGSKDNTINVIKNIKDKKIKILKNEINRGKGYSVKKGILNAKKDWILFSDADLSTPIEELDNFTKYLDYDIIIGSRNLKESNIMIHQPFYRAYPGKIFSYLVRLITIRGIKDTQCGFKLFKKEIAHKIFNKQTIDRWGFDVELMYIAHKYKYKIKELPVIWLNDEKTKLNLFKDSTRMFLDLIKIRINDLKGLYN